MNPDDRQLLLATHRGHEASARVLWDRHAPGLLAYARSILYDTAAADDAVQAVMCRILQLPRSQLAAVIDVPAFLSASVRHEALNRLRSARREAVRCSSSPRPIPASSTPDSLERSDAVSEAVSQLPRRFREVVILKHVGGLTLDQIAAALDSNRNTIASRYRSALDTLKHILEPRLISHGASDE